MAFMVPVYTKEAFVRMVDGPFDDELVPQEVESMLVADGYRTEETYTGKWFCRLSAPGYMDCTTWSGPYETVEEAKKAIEDMYEVDPETGDELVD